MAGVRTVWVGVITHRFGTNTYVGVSEDVIRRAIAEYAREWWDAEEVPGVPPSLDDDVIAQYFQNALDEEYSIDETDVLEA